MSSTSAERQGEFRPSHLQVMAQNCCVLALDGTFTPYNHHFNIVIRWVGQDQQAVGLTRLSDRLTVNRLDGETESQFQDRAAAILGGEQWQVPEFALPADGFTKVVH